MFGYFEARRGAGVVWGSVIFYQEGGLLKIWGGSGTLSKIKRGDQKIFSN